MERTAAVKHNPRQVLEEATHIRAIIARGKFWSIDMTEIWTMELIIFYTAVFVMYFILYFFSYVQIRTPNAYRYILCYWNEFILRFNITGMNLFYDSIYRGNY